MTETGRDYWMRVYAGMAMQALVGKGSFDETGLQRVDSLANRAVSISKAILDELEARQKEWIHHNYPSA